MDARTIDTYNRCADVYDDETAGFWDSFPRTILDAFMDRVGHGPVIDVGSGTGRDAQLLAARGAQVTCVDASRAMVERCRARGLAAREGDLLALPFPDTSFAGAWAYTSLLHVPKAAFPAALVEIRRVLEPGGTLMLGMLEGEGEHYRDNLGARCLRLFTYYTRDELDAHIGAAGFTTVHIETFAPKRRTYLNYVCSAS